MSSSEALESSSSTRSTHHFFARLNTPKFFTRLKSVGAQKPQLTRPSSAAVPLTKIASSPGFHINEEAPEPYKPPQALPLSVPVSVPQPQPESALAELSPERMLTPVREVSSHHSTQSRTPSPAFSNRDAGNTYEDHHVEDGEEEARDSEHYTDPTTHITSDSSGDETAEGAFDLKPPPPTAPLSDIERLAERLFSVDHLRLILQDQTLCAQFRSFLTKYRPSSVPVLQKYLDTQKALAAVEYAQALAGKLSPGSRATSLGSSFDPAVRDAAEHLVNDSLTGFVTQKLTILVTDVLVKEITGQNTPIMRELVQGLAEVYCLTDPSLPDNPIVYASEEFYRATQYGTDYVIGRNCRFLQGPKSSGATVQRLIDALAQGQEICETILNYRRDGSPFMNLLLIAPLYDNKGVVRYFIGAQIDVNGLIEGGRGIDSFERLLAQDRGKARFGDSGASLGAQQALSKLSSYWDQDEVDIITKHAHTKGSGVNSGTTTPIFGRSTNRRVLGMGSDLEDKHLWPELHLGPSGRLPGVFQNYLLVRPAPSLRITFTSPTLRHAGILQAKFLDCVVGPANVRQGLIEALADGIGVTAKISWLSPSSTDPSSPHSTTSTSASKESATGPKRHRRLSADLLSESDGGGTASRSSRRPSAPPTPQPRWIHCTPLIGSDAKVGVWMIVMVETDSIAAPLLAHPSPPPPGRTPTVATTASRNSQQQHQQQQQQHQHQQEQQQQYNPRQPAQQRGGSTRPNTGTLLSTTSTNTARIPSPPLLARSGSGGSGANRLYAEYLRIQSQHGGGAGGGSVNGNGNASSSGQMRPPTSPAATSASGSRANLTNGGGGGVGGSGDSLQGVVSGRYMSNGVQSLQSLQQQRRGGGGVRSQEQQGQQGGHAKIGAEGPAGDEFKDF